MTPSEQTTERMPKRQRVLATFGEFALQSQDLDAMLTEACRLVSEALGTKRAKVLEIEAEGEVLFVRAGVGWAPEIVGQLRLPMSEDSSETFAIRERVPVIMQDIREEKRFKLPDFLKDAGVVALANVPVVLPGGTAYGLLQVDATEPHEFGPEDTEFLRTYASLLGGAIDRLLMTQALRESEESFRAIVETATDYAIFTTDPEGRIVTWHRGAEEVFGWKAADAVGLPMDIIFTPADQEAGLSERERQQARETGQAPDVRWHQRRDGSRIFIDGMMRPLTGRDGSLRGFVKVGQDVTAQRRSEERLQLATEAADLGIFDVDLTAGTIEWDARLREFWGAEPEEVITDDSFIAGVHPDDREHVRAAIGEALDAKGQHLYRNDFRVLHRKDGTECWIAARGRVYLDEHRAVRLVGTMQDITARKHAEAALHESEARFRQFGDASADVLWIRDAKTLEFKYLSPAFEKIYGTSVEDLLSGNHMLLWMGMIVPDDRDLALEHIRRVRAGEQVLDTFRILRRSDGVVRWIRDTGFPLLDDEGQVQSIGGIGHDATEEVELQNRLRVLVAELQHRTRNLMGVVRSVTDKTLASSTSLPDFQGRIRDRLNALARVNSLLSRLDGGNRITFDELILTELMAHGVVDPSDATSQVSLQGPEGIRLRSSTVQTLALGLHELATNALKYGALSRPQGRLSVIWELLDGSDGELRLRVDWRESGVPVATVATDNALEGVSATPLHRGYGRELIERALPYQLKAETTYELTPDGVRCSITLPVSSTLSELSAAQGETDV